MLAWSLHDVMLYGSLWRALGYNAAEAQCPTLHKSWGGCMGRLCPEMKGAVVIDDVVTAVRFLLSFFRPRSRSEVQWSQHGHGTVI